MNRVWQIWSGARVLNPTNSSTVDGIVCIMYTVCMRPTTTIRVDAETHAQLVSLSQSTGRSLLATVREAADALQRQRFANRVADELAVLRADPRAWSEYIAEAEATQVPDGVH
jgi:hypothetical protein